jgi:sporulation integral membrane protein YlbJ
MLHGISSDSKNKAFTVLLAILTALFVLCILIFPDRALQSSLHGLSLWWNIVFPALLPFLIISELLIGFGLIRGLGVLLDPFMRLAFRLPGAGGWAIAMGSLAGGPAGAHITGKLRSDGSVSREQGERLLAISHMSSPFLILSVIGAGFLHHPATGTVIAAVHYISALIAAILMRFLWKERSDNQQLQLQPYPQEGKSAFKPSQASKEGIAVRFLRQMHEARLEDGRSFGKLLGDAVQNSIQTLLVIGGCIIMFSVMLHVLQLSLVTPVINHFMLMVVEWLGFQGPASPNWLPALLELHLGAYSFSQMEIVSSALLWKAAFIGFALGWSGISQHLQVQSMVRHTDLRYRPFMLHRLLHGCAAFVLTFILWKPIQALAPHIEPSFKLFLGPGNERSSFSIIEAAGVWQAVPERFMQLALLITTYVLVSGIIGLLRKNRTIH